VERSDTHRVTTTRSKPMGFASAQPILRAGVRELAEYAPLFSALRAGLETRNGD